MFMNRGHPFDKLIEIKDEVIKDKRDKFSPILISDFTPKAKHQGENTKMDCAFPIPICIDSQSIKQVICKNWKVIIGNRNWPKWLATILCLFIKKWLVLNLCWK